ncbi:MAG: hypothetical protein U0V02_11300 [Anaerolineales bacterium]
MTQPDTIVPDPYNSQDYDRYAYARNNPMRYTDPSGHATCEGANWDDGPKCLNNSNSLLSKQVKLHREFKDFDFIDSVSSDQMIYIRFPPNGDKIWADDYISPAEYKLLLFSNGSENKILMGHMLLTRQEAITRTEFYFGEGFTDGSQANAFLHAYWNALMTIRYGEEFAKNFATAHETQAGNNATSQFMDLHNNEVGRNIGANYTDYHIPGYAGQSDWVVSEKVLSALNNGDLVVIVNDYHYYSNNCPSCIIIP